MANFTRSKEAVDLNTLFSEPHKSISAENYVRNYKGGFGVFKTVVRERYRIECKAVKSVLVRVMENTAMGK